MWGPWVSGRQVSISPSPGDVNQPGTLAGRGGRHLLQPHLLLSSAGCPAQNKGTLCSPESLFLPAETEKKPRETSEWLLSLSLPSTGAGRVLFELAQFSCSKGQLPDSIWRSLSITFFVFLWPWLIWGIETIFQDRFWWRFLDQFWNAVGINTLRYAELGVMWML
jgi:hypothetical protein